jgi:hypothetical protein
VSKPKSKSYLPPSPIFIVVYFDQLPTSKTKAPSNQSKMIGATLVVTLVSLSSVSISAAATATADELVAYSMSFAEFNDIRVSESEADFGGVPTTDELWSEALMFEYKIATGHAKDKALTSLGYHPYVICNYAPVSGGQRADMVNDAFQTTPGVDVTHFFFEGISELNTDERACGLVRTFNGK